jgi:hypothetical protein
LSRCPGWVRIPAKVEVKIVQRSVLLAVAIFLLAPVVLPAQGGTWSFQSELDLFLSLKAGAEYDFSEDLGIKATAGVCLISPTQVSWTLVGVGHFMPPDSGFQLDLEFGVIQSIFDFLAPYVYNLPAMQNTYVYVIPGVCLGIGYRFPCGHQISLRAGGGVIFGYDLGAWGTPAFHPNLAVEYSWRPEL